MVWRHIFWNVLGTDYGVITGFTGSAGSYLEGVLGDGFDHLLEGYFGGESVSVVDDRFSSVSVPAVQLHAAAALIQRPVGERHVTNPPGRSGRATVAASPGRHLM